MGAFPEQHGTKKPRPFRLRRWRLSTAPGAVAVALVVVAVALVAAACGSSGGGTPLAGGTATYALPPSTAPDYIFPFDSNSHDLMVNTGYFQYLMYRPLYWFGNGASPTLNPSLSLADQPVYRGDQVTITLKGWKWSDGETVSAQDVMFWIHMLQAVGATSWGAYVPGGFPNNVSDVQVVRPAELTMTMNRAYNPAWFTDNELSQITPMPKAWDRTASGPSDCTDVVADCAKVYAYLDSQSKARANWASSPIWSVVDGPWKLASFDPDGNSTFLPNKAYSGSPRARLAKFQEVPFTSENAEYNVLRASAAGSGGQKIDVGYLPTADAPDKPADATVGSNPVNGYTLGPLYSWSINYFPLNSQSTTGNGPVIRQPYFRQALEYLMNQQAVIQGPLHGYGMYTVGPVGSYPSTSYLSAKGRQGDPFPYNPAKARQLLTSHGWNVVPRGTTTCVKPALCGPGVKQGQKLAFTLPYAAGTTWIAQEMTRLRSSASRLGIGLNLEPRPFGQVTAIAGRNCVVARASCAWDMGNWGDGWTFSPDYDPTGENLFLSGSGANSGGYTDARNDTLINQTLTSSSPQPLYAWQDYLASQVPVIWQPNGVYRLTEVADNLQGVIPQSATLAINPENWYFVK